VLHPFAKEVGHESFPMEEHDPIYSPFTKHFPTSQPTFPYHFPIFPTFPTTIPSFSNHVPTNHQSAAQKSPSETCTPACSCGSPSPQSPPQTAINICCSALHFPWLTSSQKLVLNGFLPDKLPEHPKSRGSKIFKTSFKKSCSLLQL